MDDIRINWTKCTSLHSHVGRPPCHVLPNMRAARECEMHNFAVIAMENFLRNMRREAVPIDQQINNLLQQQINRNREILKSLFNPLRPNRDLSQTSHCNIKGLLVSEVMRIENMITQAKFY